nr:unnamed protein product [Leishmania braziliensis]
MRQRNGPFATQGSSSSSPRESSRIAWCSESLLRQHMRARTSSRDTLLADLQLIRAAANTVVVWRCFLRWGLYAVRRAALRRVQHRAQIVLWRRVGARCFAWWRLVTERRLCREVLYAEAAAREGVLLLNGVCRTAWDKWRQWARAHVRQRGRAVHLGLVSRQRHAYLRFRAWTCHLHQCRQLRAVEQIRFAAERSLARFTLIRWRLHTLEGYLTFPLQVRTAQRVAAAAFRVWQRRALIGAGTRFICHEALFRVAQSFFDRWKRWLRRRLQSILLQEANEARLLLHIFLQWAWIHQLRALDYEQQVAERDLPHLFS